MRNREFWQLVDEVFGSAQGRALARELVLADLGGRTVVEALDAGTEPRTAWHALCDAMEVPESGRWGADLHRQAPPRR